MTDTDPYSLEAVRAYEILELDEQGRSIVRPDFIQAQLGKRPKIKRVLDMTCGTGAQCIHIARSGYSVTASDLSQHMIDIAASKASAERLDIDFHTADMCDVSLGEFDAIISMYNAIGHLTKADFRTTAKNALQHLTPGGLYAFDIFDRSLMHMTPTYRLIDRMREVDGTYYVRFSKFSFDANNGIISVELQTFIQKQFAEPTEVTQRFTLQAYTASELRRIVTDAGFAYVQVTPGAEAVPDEPVASLMNFGIAIKR